MGYVPRSAYTSDTTACAFVTNMKTGNHDKAAGISKSVAGCAKAAAGTLLGNPQLKAEGKAEQIAGRAQIKSGQIKKILGK
ncbi:CsbD-like protein [mine drainage metagenome]|uniref:CsbD-like protein n=1 Tax=mine drainage metagenome TaxID=410659 RepID=A0A1J5RQK7_9ZZZZ